MTPHTTVRTVPYSTHSSRRHSTAAHISAGHGPCTVPQQRAVQWHASSRKALQIVARAAVARAAVERRWRSRPCHAVLSALCISTKAATCRRDAEEDGARRRLKRVRCKHTRDVRLHRGCCTAHLPDEALRADDVLRAAGEENLYQESESSAKMTGSRVAFSRRG